MNLAQVPRMWFGDCRKRTDYCRRIRVDIGQRRDGRILASRSAATTQCSHRCESSGDPTRDLLGHTVSARRVIDEPTLRSGAGKAVMSHHMARARNRRPQTSRSVTRRGRGVRGPVLPNSVPAWRTRGEKFDLLVLEAFAPLDTRWHERLTKLDIAVDEVPKIRPLDPDSVNWPDEVVADGPVPLSRLIPAGVDRRGSATRARVVLFRRPLELRAKHPEDLIDLLHEILVQQIATYLGVDPDVIDPELAAGPD